MLLVVKTCVVFHFFLFPYFRNINLGRRGDLKVSAFDIVKVALVVPLYFLTDCSFISTHILTVTSGIWANTVMFSILKNCHPAFRKSLPFLKKTIIWESFKAHPCSSREWAVNFFYEKRNLGTLCRMEWYG